MVWARTEPLRFRLGNGAMGHQDQFVPTSPNVGCAFGQETFAGMHGNGDEAPFAAVPADHRKPGGSLRSGLSGLVTASDLLAVGLRQRHPLQEPVA